jgi:ABC-2 type transport system ATP-binding protein
VPAISVRGLRKSYGELEAVRGVSFDVGEGEVVALLGPNGAGKTTIVEILEGYRTRTAGDVAVLEVDPESGGAELRQRIGIVLQECGIDRFLTVREVLRQHSEYYRHPRAVDEVVGLVGLEEKADSRVRTLSGGQKRRLDVALGLVGDPELLFLDEPTTGFDPSARRQAWGLVERLGQLGKTVLLTTHYMDEAQVLADRVVVIAGGVVVAEGSPETIGGREQAATVISFTLPAGVAGPPLGAAADGRRWELASPDPTRDLHQLTSWALERGVALDGLRVARPSLEDVYLRLVGEPGSADGDAEGAADGAADGATDRAAGGVTGGAADASLGGSPAGSSDGSGGT